MANTYTQCYFHLVFAVKNRDALVRKEWKAEMEMYITGIVQYHQHKMLATEYLFAFFSDIYEWD